MRTRLLLLVAAFLTGTPVAFLSTTVGQVDGPLSFIAPGAESYVFDLKWGSLGSLDDEFSSPEGIALDPSGNVWVADQGNNRVSQFDSSGNFLFNFGGPGSGPGQFSSPHGIAVDANGNLWVADLFNNRVQKLDPSGQQICQTGGLTQPHGLSVNQTTGEVYIANTGANAIVRAANNCMIIGGWGSTGSGDGQFSSPHATAVDGAGNVYVADLSNNRVQKFDSTGTFLIKWGVGGSGDSRFTANPEFSGTVGIGTDANGDIFVSDFSNHRIQKFKNDGTFVTMWGWNGSGDGEFSNPVGIAVDGAGRVFVADTNNHRIQRFSPSTVDLTHLFKGKWGGLGSGDGQFSSPTGVAVDGTGNVYVADFSNNRIQKFDADGTFITKWGTPGSGDGQFSSPHGVAIDGSGNVYVTDFFNNRIQKFDASGNFVLKWGSFGTANGQFSSPAGVAVDPVTGNVYVADQSNHRIQRFDSSGVFNLGIGNGITWTGSAPTPTAGNQNRWFSSPFGVAVDGAGNLYVADTSNQRIQKFDSTGLFLTRWGSGGSGNGQFSSPDGVSVDGIGNLYVSDQFNHRVQKFNTVGRFINKWGSVGALNGLFSSPRGIAVNSTGDFIYVADVNNHRIQRFERFGFSLAADPTSQTIAAGATATYTITVTGVGPNTLGTVVSFSILSGLPPDTTATFTPPSGTPTFAATLDLATSATTTPGTYSINVEAIGGGQTRVISISLVVTP